MTPRAYIAVGSNLGDRQAWHDFALERLREANGITVLRATHIHETPPFGQSDQPAYLNRMILVETSLDPAALLATCHEIERRAGRSRRERWESRVLDLDVVRFGDILCDTATIVLPHPGIRDRTFWANEIAELEAP